MTILYKNYTIKKLQYLQANKINSVSDVRFLIGLFKKNIDNDRKAIRSKYSYITGIPAEENEQYLDFDKKWKPILDRFPDKEAPPIKKDYSYNLAYIPAYESYLYNYYLKD
jgi:hypothetical protein